MIGKVSIPEGITSYLPCRVGENCVHAEKSKLINKRFNYCGLKKMQNKEFI